jgi:putative ABC transport system substrate-binding protein
MRRRKVLALATGSAVWAASGARAQRRMPVIGILGEGYPEDRSIALNLTMFFRGLRQEGFIDGQNVKIEYRWARNHSDRLPQLAAELVALPIDVLVNEGGTSTAVVAKAATSTIPIVFHASNAITDGLVDSLAQPGGNLTGVSQFATETLVKGFQFLTELVPTARTIAVLGTGQAPAVARRVVQEIQASNAGAKVEITFLTIDSDTEREAAYAALAAKKGVMIAFANATYVDRLVSLAAKHRVPAVYNQRAYVTAGGLLSYGASIPAAYVIKGIYAGKILKGTKPGDLPVQQASKFELALNLKTAAALGLAVPQSILIGADEVIE